MTRAHLKRTCFIVLAALFPAGLACNFGVDLNGVFGQRPVNPPSNDGANDVAADAPLGDSGVPKVPVAQLALGVDSACARREDGTVMCWGYSGPEGRLGNGTTLATSVPALVKDVTDAKDVSVGVNHACVVRKSGKVACWGDNTQRQVGDGTTTATTTPHEVIELADAKSVALGSSFSCALREGGTVVCWGANGNGELGDKSKTVRSQPLPVVGIVGPATQVVAVASAACALTQTGDVYCWGWEPINSVARTEAVKINGLTGAIALGGGPAAQHVCAVTNTGLVQCWGVGNNGQLGDSKNQNSVDAVTVVGLHDATGVATGSAFTCATTKDGQNVHCFGQNNWMQLGQGDTLSPANAVTQLPVIKLSGIRQVAAGGSFACAVSQDSSKVFCWGDNYYGSLGRGTRVTADAPVKIPTPTPVTDVALGQNHGCALGPDGVVSCWGINSRSQLGTTLYPATGIPTTLGDAGGYAHVYAGDDHTCTLAGNVLQCLGRGGEGQFGNGGQSDSLQLVGVSDAAVSAAAGGLYTCFRIETGEVLCAGQDNYGQLGFNGGGGNILTPAAVRAPALPPLDAGDEAAPPTGNLMPVDTVFAGRMHACAIVNGALYCWGDKDEGQCGPGGQAREVPQEVPLPNPPIHAAVGANHTCAVLTDQSVRCWGQNTWGQVTGSDPSSSALRTPDFGGKGALELAAGDAHTCARLADETVACWGQGGYGQLGGGVRADANRPMPVPDLVNVKRIFARSSQTCALVADGSLFCWGLNWFGQLGDGAVMVTGVPGPIVGYE
jgi:alpha-tubulin suppressor-like RCC1 family protein